MGSVFALHRALLAMIFATFLQAPAVAACEMVHALDFAVEKGKYELRINGVFVALDEGYSQGTRPILPEDWLVEGNNTVAVTFLEEGGIPEAAFAIVTGCRGGFPEGDPLARVAIAAPGTQVLEFMNEQPVNALHMQAEAADAGGLMDAVARLQAAIEERDVEAVLALHAPMLSDAERRGAPVEQLTGMIAFLVSEQDARLERDLIAEPALEGRIHQVMTRDRQPPVTIQISEDGGTLSWRTGVYWGRFDGKWGVLALY